MNRLDELVILINHKRDKLNNQHWTTKEEGFRELKIETTVLLNLIDEYIKWKDDRDTRVNCADYCPTCGSLDIVPGHPSCNCK